MCPCTLPGIQVCHALVHLKVSTVLVHNAWRLTVCNFFHSATKSMDLVTVQFKDESCLSNFSCKESLWAMNKSEADEPRSVRRAVWSKTKTECTSVKLWQGASQWRFLWCLMFISVHRWHIFCAYDRSTFHANLFVWFFLTNRAEELPIILKRRSKLRLSNTTKKTKNATIQHQTSSTNISHHSNTPQIIRVSSLFFLLNLATRNLYSLL